MLFGLLDSLAFADQIINPPASGSGYSTFEDEGTPQTQRTTANFTGDGVTVSDSGGETLVNIPGGVGSFTVTEAEIDFGTTPVSEASFVITNAAITTSHMILSSVSYEAPTGKDQDELEMDDLQLRAVAGTGNFTLYVRAADGSYLADKFKINYSFA